MHLALKTTPASSATWRERAICSAIKWRLASSYCHGGIVLDGRMLHVTPERGLHASSFESDKWELYDCGPARDEAVDVLFEHFKDTPYAMRGLMPFVVPQRIHAGTLAMYCFAWCALGQGADTGRLCTPEYCLQTALARMGRRVIVDMSSSGMGALQLA